MHTQISQPTAPITIAIPAGIQHGFDNSIFPWHQLGASNQTKGDAGVSVVIACMQAHGLQPKKINGEGDILLPSSKSEVKYIRETVSPRSDGVSSNWRCNGIRPNKSEWKYIYLVVEQGDHANNEWAVVEFTRDAMLDILDDGIISMYGQPGAIEEDRDNTNVMEIRASENSRTSNISGYLLPKALNVIYVPQKMLNIITIKH